MKLQTTSGPLPGTIERIEHFVHLRTNGMVRDLNVEVVGGTVVLTGRTATYYNKQLATHAVLSTMSDVVLTNDIEVR